MRLIFLGPPGSGKGTQAKRLSERLNLAKVSSGDIFREEIAKKTTLGLQAQHYNDQGLLVPDKLTCEIVFKKLEQLGLANGFILDGFPRSLPQAVSLEGFLSHKNLSLDAVFYLDVEEDALLERLSQRRQCKSCQRVYNLESDSSRVGGICDNCGGSLFIRDDDRPETIHRRLLIYRDSTYALVEHYEKLKLLIRLEASKAIDEVTQDLIDAIHLCRH